MSERKPGHFTMDNEALMRRIAAATEAQNARLAAKATAPQPAAVQATPPPAYAPLPPVAERQTGPSHIDQILAKRAEQAAANAAQAAPQPISAQHHPTRRAEDMASFQPAAPEQHGLFDAEEANAIGVLVACNGVHATIQAQLAPSDKGADDGVRIGQMVVMPVGESRVVGLVISIEQILNQTTRLDCLRVSLELQGEFSKTSDGGQTFCKGISAYPAAGCPAKRIEPEDLATLYAASGELIHEVGKLAQESTIAAHVDIGHMLAKHFAVLGSTGCGKSSAVSLLLHAASEIVPDLHTVILDPHNEFGRAFPNANSLTSDNLDIPFWMFQLEEYAEVLFRGKPVIAEEIDVLRELIPVARQRYREGEERNSLRIASHSPLTSDTPVPYRISDVLALLDEELGVLESRHDRSTLKSLRARINAHCADPRYRFMFRDKTISDKAEEVLDQFFNLSGTRHTISVLQMQGMPSEVVNVVASILCRLAFELCIAAKGALKVLTVCEEAHRYVPRDPVGGFDPTRRAVARIAKEGRKYGSYLGIVSQRPGELDPTILSQCSTVFAMRMSNDYDQDLIRKAISSASASTVSFLSALSNREAIAFGEALSTPMRLRFKSIPAEWQPGAEAEQFIEEMRQPGAVFRQWRGAAGAPTPVPQQQVA